MIDEHIHCKRCDKVIYASQEGDIRVRYDLRLGICDECIKKAGIETLENDWKQEDFSTTDGR